MASWTEAPRAHPPSAHTQQVETDQDQPAGRCAAVARLAEDVRAGPILPLRPPGRGQAVYRKARLEGGQSGPEVPGRIVHSRTCGKG